MRWNSFRYLGYGYTVEDGKIRGCAWGNSRSGGFVVHAGFMKFDEVQTAAILCWLNNMGFAGMSLEEYLDKVLGGPV